MRDYFTHIYSTAASYARTLDTRTAYITTLIAITIIFIGLRFVNMEADFPSDVTWAGVLYTDEGWYTNAAVNYMVSGEWYLEGDFNPVVNLPIGYAIQAGTFSAIGTSIASARVTIAAFFVLVVVFSYLLANKYANKLTSIFVALFLAANYMVFSYSRLATFEIIMMSFVVLSFLVVSSFGRRRNALAIVLSALIMAVAVLTKSTAISGLPVLIYLSSLRGKGRKQRILFAAGSTLVCVIVVLAYNMFVLQTYPEDFLYFKSLNYDNRVSFAPSSVVINYLRAVFRAHRIEPVIYAFSLLFGMILLLRHQKFRQNILVHVSLLWLVASFGMLCVTWYQPPRYFLPLAVPIAFLFGAVLSTLRQYLDKRAAIVVQLVIITYVVGLNGYRIAQYLRTPQYSFVNMAREVKQLVKDDRRGIQDATLLGDMANSISLETHLRSISVVGTHTIDWKIARYKPRYYVSLGTESEVIDLLNKKYDLRQISAWDIFDNYYDDKKVYLYELGALERDHHGTQYDSTLGDSELAGP